MKDFLKTLSRFCIIVYFSASIVCFIAGISNKISDQNYPQYRQDCKIHTRAGYFFPAYRLGCYLGERVE